MLKWENLCCVNTAGSGPDSLYLLMPSPVSICGQLTAHSCNLCQTIVLGRNPLPRHGDTSGVMPQPPLWSLANQQLMWAYQSPFTSRQDDSVAWFVLQSSSVGSGWCYTLLDTTSLLISLPFPVLLLHSLIRSPPSIQHMHPILVSGSASRESAHLQSWVRKLWPAGQPPVCANKVLLENNYARYLHIAYGCFCTTIADLNSCDRNCIFHKFWNTYYLAF